MIDTKELRRGNILLLSGNIVRVAEIGTGHVCLKDINRPTDNPQYPFEYNPISAADVNLQPYNLTEERMRILLGVIPTEHGLAFRFTRTATYLIYPDGEGAFFIGLDNKGQLQRVTPKPFSTLHDMQNIHFSMYGIEIEIEDVRLSTALRF